MTTMYYVEVLAVRDGYAVWRTIRPPEQKEPFVIGLDAARSWQLYVKSCGWKRSRIMEVHA